MFVEASFSVPIRQHITSLRCECTCLGFADHDVCGVWRGLKSQDSIVSAPLVHQGMRLYWIHKPFALKLKIE